jgi:hypothetical protein
MSKHVPPPTGEPVEGFYLPTDVSPEEVFQAIGRLRKEARDEINRLIGFLDKTDDYVSRELEDAVDDNPCDDNELDGPENGEDELSEPDEPSLGSIEKSCSLYGPDGHNPTGDQTRWGDSGTKDLEDEHDGAEPPDDAEPSLGSFDRILDQTTSWDMRIDDCVFSSSDCEQDDCDAEDDDPEEISEPSGIADHDGLQEQYSGRVFPSGLKIEGVV